MTASISELRRDHVNFSLMLNVLARQAGAVELERKPVSLKLIQLALKYFRSYPRKFHHPKEDAIYGLLIQKHFRKPETIYNIMEDHSDLRDALRILSEQAESLDLRSEEAVGAFCEKLRLFVAREHHHIAMEEGHLYPTALQMFSPEDWKSISDSFGNETDPVFGEATAAKLDSLIAAVLMHDALSRDPELVSP
jgi:hemerythrin-like domain-containing protein